MYPRLIILESAAGVPGMLGGMFRHFRSLRQLERDHGFIFTLLEEVALTITLTLTLTLTRR